jgi:hypothetical protein
MQVFRKANPPPPLTGKVSTEGLSGAIMSLAPIKKSMTHINNFVDLTVGILAGV